jgi:stearoyl-CoA desaturase (Delta-9 desaturase)
LPPDPVIPAPLPEKPLASGLPSWLKNAPFFTIHLLCLLVFVTGVDALSLTLCASLYLIRMFGITGGYHRYFAHRAYKTSRVFQFVLAWIGCSALQKGPLWWCSHHRHHHRHSDTGEDVHSPYQPSLWWSHLGWVLSGDYEETDWEAVHDFDRYPELRWLNRYHWIPGILLGTFCFLVGGWSGLIVGFFISTVLCYHITFTINSLSHRFGSRRYATEDDSRNNAVLAVLTLGEGWHNNHHHYQSSANQGFFWWEVDFSYYAIVALSWVGLVWDVRKPPQEKLTADLADGVPFVVQRATQTAGSGKN